MVEFRFVSEVKEKLTPLYYLLCSGFVGWDSFIDNKVVVADPCKHSLEDDDEAQYWSMSAYIGPGNKADSVITIDLDTLGEDFTASCANKDVCEKCETDYFHCNVMN